MAKNIKLTAADRGGVKERIKRVLHFKKPSRVRIAAIVLVAVLSVGFAVNGISGDNPKDWASYDFPYFNYHDPDNTLNPDVKVSFNTDEGTYPPSVHVINARLTNVAIASELTCGTYFTLVRQLGDEWRVVPFKDDIGFDSIAILLGIGQSETYTITRDMFAADLTPGKYRIVTDVWYRGARVAYLPPEAAPQENDPAFYNMEKLTVWADFHISENEADPRPITPPDAPGIDEG